MAKKTKIAIIGLGYVGLPLLIYATKKYDCIGFDIDKKIIEDLSKRNDARNILTSKEKRSLKNIKVTDDESSLGNCNVFIVTVPTPIDELKNPDLTSIIHATKLIAKYIKKKDLVIYESTVYPGVTEEICVPIIEKISKLKLNKEFYCGYSPERVNPGDADRTLDKIIKVTSGSNDYAAKEVNKIYNNIIDAGTFMAESIKVAEMSKVIENTQRDLNIGLMNEIAIICEKLGISTSSVLNSAKSKWNFLNFYPGLVGGHCISVDPYYLTYKSKEISYNPELILAARKINDNLSQYIVDQFVNGLISKKIKLAKAKVIILGATFKENVSDIRNSKVFDIINILRKRQVTVNFYDPLIKKEMLDIKLKKLMVSNLKGKKYDGLIYAVNHREFSKLKATELSAVLKKVSFVYDLKSALPSSIVDQSL